MRAAPSPRFANAHALSHAHAGATVSAHVNVSGTADAQPSAHATLGAPAFGSARSAVGGGGGGGDASVTTYYSSAPPRQQQQQQQQLFEKREEQQQVPRVQVLEAHPRQQQQPPSGASLGLGLGHGHGHPAPLGLGPPSPSALSFASTHLPAMQTTHQGSQLSPSNPLSTHEQPQHAAPSKPAHPLLTPSGRAFAVGGRVQNVSRDPRAPCVMYWPDNEALPEQGQIRPGCVAGIAVRCVFFSLFFFSFFLPAYCAVFVPAFHRCATLIPHFLFFDFLAL